MRRLIVILALTVVTAGSLGAAGASGSAGGESARPGLAPYRPPTFHCTVHHYGNGQAPNPAKLKADPLCVDYNKRDITVDNGGALRFLAAEPDRFAVAGKCRYWQQDHWSVQLDRGYGPVVRWDGSYWWDLRRGVGAGILRHFRIAGQPVGPTQAAAAVRTVSPTLARDIARYGAGPGGGGGASVTLPQGAGC